MNPGVLSIVVALLAGTIVGAIHVGTSRRRVRPSGGAVATSSRLPGVTVRFHAWSGGGDALPAETTWLLSAGGGRYAFTFVQLPDARCRAYIRRAPSYGVRPAGLHETHRHLDGLGRPFVCFEPEPQVPQHLLAIVAAWMTATDNYRETGTFTLPTWAG